MHIFSPLLSYQMLLFFCMLVLNINLVATPKSTLSKNELKLVMIDFAHQGLVVTQKTKKQITLSKQAAQLFPANCLKWNAWQVKQRAKPFDKVINKYASQYGVDSNLVRSVITAESCFKVKALSHAGAQGLMQLIPATAERFGVKNSYDSEQNIKGGVKYLSFLLDRFDGNLEKTIAAYNAGEGKVDKYKGIPPYKETKQYVKNVLKVHALIRPVKKSAIKKVKLQKKRVKAIYYPPKLGQKPGRHGWQYNRRLAPHLYKK